MDGGRSAAAQWRSSIPGVWQREGAPATLGIVASGGRGSAQGDAPAGEAAGLRGNPVRGGALTGRTRHARGWRRLPWRATALAGLGLVAVVGIARVAGADADAAGAAVGTGWELPAAEPSSTAEAPLAGPKAVNHRRSGSPDWWEVLVELDRRRAQALTALDADRIEDYAQPGSAAWQSDSALVADLRARGLRPQGLTSRVLAVERAESSGSQAQVQVVDQRSAYTLVDAQGSVVESVPEAALTRWSVTLAEDPGGPPGWRVVDVASELGAEGGSDGTGEPSGELEP